jgi:predicted amidohydrolase YtcJ
MSEYADRIIVNARVHTVDPDRPRAEAVAVRGNRIHFIGSTAAALAYRDAQTEIVDGGQRTLLPGFIDSHFHLLWGARELAGIQLANAATLEEILAGVKAYGAHHPEEEWLVGYQVRYSASPAGRGLTRQMLDAVVPDRPVFLLAFDSHTAWANSLALEKAGILHGRSTQAGSEIVMASAQAGKAATATGELREPAAYNFVRDLIPPPTAAATRSLLRRGLEHAARHGITSVHNMDGAQERIELYAEFEERDEMTLRIYVPYDVTPETSVDALQEAAAWRQQFQGSHVRAGAVKFFMDGVLESSTALLLDDYADEPGNRGAVLFTAEHFDAMAAAADRLGLQIFVHACGDGAVRRTLDGYAHARRVNGPRDSRHRVEHIEVIHPDDLPRFAELGVIASMQPLHAPLAPDPADVWPVKAGPGRWPYSFAWETLRQAGARLAYGSDWPVVSLDPMLGIAAGRNRQPLADGDPDQRQTLADLIAGYTRDAAYAEFMEDEKGMIRPGMLADLVLLSADLFAVPDEALAEVKPVLTVCDGRIVFAA